MELIINNELSHEYGLSISDRPVIPTPEQRIDRITVDYRDGELTRKKGYSNVTIDVELNILEDFNIKGQLRKIKAWLMGAKTLRFSDDEVYYKVKNVRIGDIDNEVEFYGSFTASFECDPFQYLICKKITLTEAGTVRGRCTYESLPEITIYGSGDITLIVNDTTIKLKSVSGHVILDCDIKEAYRQDSKPVNLNSLMTGEFPVFKTGNNTISWIGKVTSVVIDPRWRFI